MLRGHAPHEALVFTPLAQDAVPPRPQREPPLAAQRRRPQQLGRVLLPIVDAVTAAVHLHDGRGDRQGSFGQTKGEKSKEDYVDLKHQRDLVFLQIIYQCTFPGCREHRTEVEAIESHVRVEHLHRPEVIDDDDEERDHEEEFYYTEIELDGTDGPLKHLASLSLADHWDMARPPHEDPNRAKRAYNAKSAISSPHPASLLSKSLPTHSTINVPLTIAPSMVRKEK